VQKRRDKIFFIFYDLWVNIIFQPILKERGGFVNIKIGYINRGDVLAAPATVRSVAFRVPPPLEGEEWQRHLQRSEGEGL